ncbi:hypothetical protein BS47DRAFT_1365259 [Hydnum rufescens UP504]|uniref:Uncharacterized protein n=1 Tax=Hydnum rufescens UP504 TaxID=1448309 RepID=A0A9P6APE3_9AGAM|nr:hypothetical protein BS47DRAFT_1365259 [Hydnum rufescens UP504]
MTPHMIKHEHPQSKRGSHTPTVAGVWPYKVKVPHPDVQAHTAMNPNPRRQTCAATNAIPRLQTHVVTNVNSTMVPHIALRQTKSPADTNDTSRMHKYTLWVAPEPANEGQLQSRKKSSHRLLFLGASLGPLGSDI